MMAVYAVNFNSVFECGAQLELRIVCRLFYWHNRSRENIVWSVEMSENDVWPLNGILFPALTC
jgi:hypothetical protein